MVVQYADDTQLLVSGPNLSYTTPSLVWSMSWPRSMTGLDPMA